MSDWYNNLRTIQTARRKHDDQLEKDRIITPGEVVSQNGSTTVTEMGLSFTWAKLRSSSNPPVAALNMTAVTAEGTPVLLARSPKPPYHWQILGPDPTFVRAEMTLPVGNYASGTHGSNHQTAEESNPGPDPVDVFQPMMKMLKTEGDGISLTVSTYPYDYNQAGDSQYFAGTTTDLTSSVPGAGLIRKVLIYLDRDTGTLETVDGTAVADDSVTPIPLPDVPAGVSATKSAWVTLANGQTSISTASDIDDARDFLSQTDTPDTETGEIMLSSAGGWPSTTNGCAPNVKVETSTNKQNQYVLDFDQSTNEYAEWTVLMPDHWDAGVVAALFVWTAASGTGNVVWGLQGVAYNDGDDLDAAWGSARSVLDALIATGKDHVSELTNAITIGGSPIAGSLVQFRVFRDTSIGNNLNADARLLSVKLYYTKISGPQIDLSSLSTDNTVRSSITADAYIQKSVSASISADATIQTTESGSITADAFLQQSVSSSISADATILNTVSSSVAADATILNTQSSSITADADIV